MAGRYRFGEFELDTKSLELRHRDTRVSLEPKVLELLTHLLRHRDRHVSVPELLTAVWADTSVERGSVHRAVRLLRRALSRHAPRLEAIETLPRRGYRFSRPVTEIPDSSPTPARDSFIGREEIRAELDARLDRTVQGGKTELVLLHGPAGIGKSATLLHLAHSAERMGAVVFEGRCIEGPAAAPYRPWSRILRASLRLDGASDLAAGLRVGMPDIARALPEIGAALGVPAPSNVLIDPAARYRVHAAIAEWIRHRCRRAPLVVLLDDLHRADLDSIQLLEYLIQDLVDEPLLLAAAYRDGPDQIANLAALNALISLRPSAPMQLAEFSRGEVEAFARSRTGDAWTPSELDGLASASGGNPLFIEQLLRTRSTDRVAGAPDPRSAGLRGALRRILEGASEPCSEMLSLACVFGRGFEPRVLAAGLEWSMLEIQSAIEEATLLHLLEPDEDPEMRFAHGLFPEVLYAGLTSTARVERHGRALAGILATRGGARHRLNEVAHHAHQAASLVGIRQAFEYAVAAARDARERLAYEDAIRLFKSAVAMRGAKAAEEIDPSARAYCMIELATLMVMRGAATTARPHFDEAAELAREQDDPVLFAHAALGPTHVEEYDKLDAQRFDTLSEALSRLGDRDPALRVQLLNAHVKTGYYDKPERSLDATEEALGLARPLGDPELLCTSLLVRSEALGWTHRQGERVKLVREAREIANRDGVPPMTEGWVLRHAAYEALTSGDRAGYEEHLRSLERMAKVNRLAFFDWLVTAMRGTLALLEGRFDSVRSLLVKQMEIGKHANPVLAFQIAGAHTVMMEIAFGEAESVVSKMRVFIEQFPHPAPWQATLALALAESGHPRQAKEQVEELIRSNFEPRHRDFLPVVLAALAQSVQRIGEPELAEILSAELAALDDRCVVVGVCLATYGAVDRYRGLCQETMGHFGAAIEFYEEALRLDEAMGAHPFVAHGLADLGRVLLLRAEGDDVQSAKRHLGRGFKLASELGMKGVAEATRVGAAAS